MTLVDEVTWEDPLMQEELFGPILPVVTYETREEMISAESYRKEKRKKELNHSKFNKNSRKNHKRR